MVKRVVYDFDGVIHSYMSGWKGEAIISDPPVPGIKESIDELRAHEYEVCVVSTRCRSEEGRNAIERYLAENNIIVDGIFAEKPPAVCYIDDRAICFDGHPEKLVDKVLNFKTWNEMPKFQKCIVLGTPALFTIDRLKREDYPYLNRYELMYEGEGDICALQTDVLANFYGSILSKKVIIDNRSRKYYVRNGNLGMNLDESDIDITNDFTTIKEYMEEFE